MPDTVVLSGNPRSQSRTASFAASLARALHLDVQHTIELADVVAVGFGAEPVRPRVPRLDALDLVRTASVLLVATPSYKGTYTGLLKVFLDRFGSGELTGARAVPIALAGSRAHATATADDLARLLRELGASTTSPVPVIEAQLADTDLIAASHARRLTTELTPITA